MLRSALTISHDQKKNLITIKMKGGLFYRLGDLGIKIPFYN